MSNLLMIIMVQLIFVPMLTLRTICMVKNLKLLTAFFGFLEAIVYIFGLTIVLSGEQNYLEMIIYSIGFSLGLIVGIIIEQRMAIGHVSYHVNMQSLNEELVRVLREKGYGVTVFKGMGKIGERNRLDILTRRKMQKSLFDLIYQYEPNAFIISYEPKMFKGGYLVNIMKKRMKSNKSDISKNNQKTILRQTIQEMKKELKIFKKSWKK